MSIAKAEVMAWLLSKAKIACSVHWLLLHDHVAGGQNSDMEHFDGKKCGLSQGLFCFGLVCFYYR